MGDHPSATGSMRHRHRALPSRKNRHSGVAQSSLLQNGLWANACFVQTRLFGEQVPHRPPRAQAPNPLANHYRCRDGRWFLMALHNEPRQLASFLKRSAPSTSPQDPRFATTPARRANARELTAILEGVFVRPRLGEWRPILEKAGVTFGAVYSVNEAADDTQSREIGALVPFADGAGLTVSSPFHLDGAIKVAPVRAPTVGQHSESAAARRRLRCRRDRTAESARRVAGVKGAALSKGLVGQTCCPAVRSCKRHRRAPPICGPSPSPAKNNRPFTGSARCRRLSAQPILAAE